MSEKEEFPAGTPVVRLDLTSQLARLIAGLLLSYAEMLNEQALPIEDAVTQTNLMGDSVKIAAMAKAIDELADEVDADASATQGDEAKTSEPEAPETTEQN